MPIYPPSQSLVPLLLTQATSRRRHHRHRRHSLTYDNHHSHAKTSLSPPSSPTPPHSADQVVWSFGGDSEVEDNVEDNVRHEVEHEVDDEDEHSEGSTDEQELLESGNESGDASSLDSESDESDSSSLSLIYLTDGDENNGEPFLDPIDPSSLDFADPETSATTTTTTTHSLDDLRQASSLRLAQAWKDIFERYERRGENEADDEIDLMTGEIIVDQGFLRDQEKTLFGTMTRLGLELKGPQKEEQERLRKADRIARRRSKDRQLKHKGASESRQHSHQRGGRSDEGRRKDEGPPHQVYGGDDFDNLLFVPKDSKAAPLPDTSRHFIIERSKSPEKSESPQRIADEDSDLPKSSASDWDSEENEDWDQQEEEENNAEEEPAVSPIRVSERPTASDTLPFQSESSLPSRHSGSLEERMDLINRRRSRMMPRTVALADSLFSKRPSSLTVRSSSPSPPLPSVSAPPPGWSSPSRPIPATTGSIRPSTATATTTLTSLLLARSIKRKHNHMEDEDMLRYDQEEEEQEEKEDAEEKDLFGFTPSPSPPRSLAPSSPPPSNLPKYFTTPTKKQRQEGQFSSAGIFGSSLPFTTTTSTTGATAATTVGVLTTPRTALARTIDLLSLQSPPPPAPNRAPLAPLPPLPSLPPFPLLSLPPLSGPLSAVSATPPGTLIDNREGLSPSPAPPTLPTCGGPDFCTKDFCFECM